MLIMKTKPKQPEEQHLLNLFYLHALCNKDGPRVSRQHVQRHRPQRHRCAAPPPTGGNQGSAGRAARAVCSRSTRRVAVTQASPSQEPRQLAWSRAPALKGAAVSHFSLSAPAAPHFDIRAGGVTVAARRGGGAKREYSEHSCRESTPPSLAGTPRPPRLGLAWRGL